MPVQTFDHRLLPALGELVNLHLAAVVPGWALSERAIAAHLERDDTEYVTDPWVRERATLCAVEGYRVVAAVHLLGYGESADVGENYRGIGEIAWFLFRPDDADAASRVLAAARERLRSWRCMRQYGWGPSLPAPAFGGVPDTWPHVAAALEAVGFRPSAEGREALYGGRLDRIPAPPPPVEALHVHRSPGLFGTRFAAVLDGKEVGHCECAQDLTRGGRLPALGGWAELSELRVEDRWRNRGIGGWLVRRAAAWLRLGGCDRIVLSVAEDDEARGAGRFYTRFGWDVLAREIRTWPDAADG